MARQQSQLSQLKAENARLRAENEKLKQQAGPSRGSKWRSFGAAFFIGLAVLLLIVGNLLFWTGNSLVKSDRFSEAVSPIIKNSTVQKAVAGYTTTQLYSQVDVASYIGQALPPRAEFLAPTIANQLKSTTQSALNKILASPDFQAKWNKLLTNAQSKFITTVKQGGSDGMISLNELYQQVSDSLENTSLSFLANKKLPDKVGSIQVLSAGWIAPAHRVVTHIDLWRTLAILLFLASSALGIYLSRRRRRAVITLGLTAAGGLFVSLVVLRIVRETVTDKVAPVYADAVRQTVQTVFHPLVVQTFTLLAAFLAVALIAWITGSGKSAVFVRDRTSTLAAGKLHPAIFGDKENAVTLWVGKYKRWLEWGFVGLIAVLSLFTRLSPSTLIIYLVLILLFALVVEIVGA